MLPCLHTVCDSCIQGSSSSASKKCPICRFPYPSLPAAEQRDNLLAVNLIEALALKDASFNPPCDECDDGHPATHRCLTCALYLCAICLAQHVRAKTTKDHPTQALADARAALDGADGVLDLVRRPAEPCRAAGHEGQRLTMYCWKCSRLVCMQCVALEHPRPAHECLPAEEAFAAQSRLWQAALGDLQAEQGRLAAAEADARGAQLALAANAEAARAALAALVAAVLDDLRAREQVARPARRATSREGGGSGGARPEPVPRAVSGAVRHGRGP